MSIFNQRVTGSRWFGLLANRWQGLKTARKRHILRADQLVEEVEAMMKIGKFLRCSGSSVTNCRIARLAKPDETGCNWMAHLPDSGEDNTTLRRAIEVVQEHYNLL